MERVGELLNDRLDSDPLHSVEECLDSQTPSQNDLVADEEGKLPFRVGTSTEDSTSPEEGFSYSQGFNEIDSSFVVDISGNSNSLDVKESDGNLTCPVPTDDPSRGGGKNNDEEQLFGASLFELCETINSYVNGLKHEEIAHLGRFGGRTGLLEKLKTSSETGLTVETMFETQRVNTFGRNKLPKRKLSSFAHLCYEAFRDLILRILVVCGGLSLAIGVIFGDNPAVDWVEGFVIWLAVLVVILVTAGNDWAKERQFDKLSSLNDAKNCNVLRNGEQLEISVFSLMVGDILLVEAGDEIAADCLAINTNNLKMDESSLTGESKKIEKVPIDESIRPNDDSNHTASKGVNFIEERHSSVLLSGSTVSEGAGVLVVVAVGVDSTSGNLFGKMAFEADPTPLQNKLNALAHDIGKAGLISAVVCFFLLVLQFWILWFFGGNTIRTPQIIRQHVEAVIISITILVVAVPEGLPLAVTLSLAYSIGRMLKDQNFVRRLAACEIMGGATEICSDKTGTLTENKMSVSTFWNGFRLETLDSRDNPLKLHIPPYLEPFLEGLALNSTSYLQEEERVVNTKKRKTTVSVGIGSSSECALLYLLQRLGYDYKQIREEKLQGSMLVHRECFSSERKMMSTVIKLCGRDEGKYRIYVKGAAEKVLRCCNQKIDSKGNLKRLDKEEIQRIDKHVIHQMASQALRPLCLAYKDFEPTKEGDWREYNEIDGLFQMERNLICLGIAGIRDPIRFGVPTAIRQCQNAGIKVRMVTGDNIETAKQIAIQCNIYHPEAGGVAMLGVDFYKLVGGVVCRLCLTEQCQCSVNSSSNPSGKPKRVDVLGDQEAFHNLEYRLEILARARPKDKYAIVTGLRAEGAVVAVTGDGANDAPALKKADVGFAMGIAGKEVAKLSADIVMLDDNFESIVKAVKWGRNIYENIRRFLIFQLTVNVVAVSFTILTALVLRQAPLTAVQLLWVNMIMDSFGSLALATEPPSDELLQRKPHSRTEYLISKSMFGSILSQAVYQLAVLLLLIFYADKFVPEERWDYLSTAVRIENNFCEFSDCGPGCWPACSGTIMRSGRRFFPFSNLSDYAIQWETSIGPSRHLTLIFNTFVWMQIVNLLNARNMHRKWNMLSGLWTNKFWMGIFLLISLGQTLFIEFGGYVVSCHLEGLTGMQWSICILFSLGGIIVHYVMKLFPDQILPEAGQKEMNPLHEPKSIALASRGRISRERISHRLTAGLGHTSEAQRNLVRRSRTQHLSRKDTILRSSTLKM
ncbi:plasma membrane-type Ca(2+)-ATPase A1 PMCAA1 [Cardiosporidium cionae]|uniref:Plasma membrane-type Ca(2+)-ATPase A1 PMCAA1 n=1 Tax=Cardiosporidium cionae TaxID=476202 RepID=A0ABQ7JF12_9APIC|nr:plasma membrane-type Ca(2+)-ATPase A1 PMCAA1 [Cardiosporidium cionae]|eukprot:KAF8822583.1 plasma membrane-type Ca(2+)-ATPase A1 PMCAA1 [Cardiosporidium cionae]